MKIIFKFSLALTVFVALAFVLACSRQNPEYLGPAYVSAPEGFAVVSPLTSSNTNPDFNPAVATTFDATFSSSVSWTLTLTGQTSGAVRTFTGISSGFTGLEWWGDHDGVFFFRKGELVTATLSFFGTSMTAEAVAPITIVEAPNYQTCGKFSRYGDFEDETRITGANNWFPFSNPTTPIANVLQGVDSVAIDYNGNPVPSVEGKKYYYIKGKGAQATFVSGMQFTRTSNLSGLPADANEVWVNMYIYGTGDANAGVELEYQEADFDGAPGYQGTDDDAFVARITLNHVGWKLFSFKYSDLTPSLNADFGGSGNKMHEPNRLRSWDIVVVKKTDPNSAIEVYFDYPIITVGGPFKPCH